MMLRLAVVGVAVVNAAFAAVLVPAIHRKPTKPAAPESATVANVVPTPSFERGDGVWAAFADSHGGGRMASRVVRDSGGARLVLTRRGSTQPEGFVQRFVDIQLQAGQVYQLGVHGSFTSIGGPADQAARVAIAPRATWYARDNELDFTPVRRPDWRSLIFRAKVTGPYRLSLLLERADGRFEVDRVWLSGPGTGWFDGDLKGAKWTGRPGASISVRDAR